MTLPEFPTTTLALSSHMTVAWGYDDDMQGTLSVSPSLIMYVGAADKGAVIIGFTETRRNKHSLLKSHSTDLPRRTCIVITLLLQTGLV